MCGYDVKVMKPVLILTHTHTTQWTSSENFDYYIDIETIRDHNCM